jgi:hypothetical protein
MYLITRKRKSQCGFNIVRKKGRRGRGIRIEPQHVTRVDRRIPTHLPHKALLENKLRELRELAEAENLANNEENGDTEE